ncbi:MAG: hypothetical protein CML13_08445 [Puniceicoccaceae bacterium]|nr:hypothetical protein [Puniceicoccaceae bacterium]
MGFVLLLLLSMTALVQVETRSSKMSAEVRVARENALLGLNVAIGEVQKYLGPDARVSARMEFFRADDPSTPEMDAPNNRWLTAVWDSSDLTDEQEPAGLPRFLISGNDQTRFDPLNEDSEYPTDYLNPNSDELPDPDTNDDYVWLYQDRRLEADRLVDGSVKALIERNRIIGSDGNGTGGFAWVVLDEGVKSKVNPRYTMDEIVAHRSAQTNAAVLSTERPAAELMDGMSHLAFETPEWSKMQRVTQNGDFDFFTAPATPDLSQVIYHAVTDQSAGVLSKTTYDATSALWGGLKRDLTNGLRPNEIDPLLEGQPIFPGATSIVGDSGGPLWDQLHSWVNLTPTTAGAGLEAIYEAEAVHGDRAGISPVLTLAQLSLSVIVLPDTAGQYAVWFYFQPTFALWNPYDAAIAGSPWYVDMKLSDDPASQLNWKYQIKYTDGGATKHQPPSYKNRSKYSLGDCGLSTLSYGRIPFILDLGRNLEAGEAVVFSAPNPVSTVSDGASGWRLTPGYRGGFSYVYRVPNSEFSMGNDDSVIYKLAGFGEQRFVDERSIPGDLRMADSLSNLENQPLLYISGFNYGGGTDQDFAVVESSEIHIAGAPIPDTKPNISLISGLKFSQSRLEESENTRVQWLGYLNPAATYSGRTPSEARLNSGRAGFNNNPAWKSGFYKEPTVDFISMPTSGNNAFVGFTDAATSNNTSAVLFHLPRDPLEIRSIGDLMHARLTVAKGLDDAVDYWKWSNATPAYAIGNSNATPYITYNKTYSDHPENVAAPYSSDVPEMVSYDMSWNLNTALWDDYFFSAIPVKDEREDYPLLTPMVSKNSRIYSISGEESVDLDSMTLAAKELMVDGAFNVNSTSIDAWESLLGTFLGATVDTTIDGDFEYETEAPWLRHPFPQTAEMDASLGTLPEESEAYSGFRALTKDEIRLLAENIVVEVKKRGPFISVADFVNRSVYHSDTESSLHRRGALQAAINATGLNAAFFSGSSNEYSENDPHNDLYKGERFSYGYYRNAMAGSFSTNAPGYLSQADIMSKIGSVLVARSDTFKIRAYGESESPLSGERVKVWCEAIVQRMPEKVDRLEDVVTGDPEGGFGRRFTIKSFRWLDPDEV